MIEYKLNELLKLKGKEKGIETKTALADATGISRATISKISNQQLSTIRLSTLEKICIALDCEPGDLLKLDKTKI